MLDLLRKEETTQGQAKVAIESIRSKVSTAVNEVCKMMELSSRKISESFRNICNNGLVGKDETNL